MTVRLPVPGRNLLLPIAGVAGLALLVQFVFFPFFTRLKNLHHEHQVRTKVLTELVNLTAHADQVESEYPRYMRYIQAELSQEEKEGIFLKDVEAMAKSSAVQVVSQQPYTVKDGADFLEISLRLDVEAQLRDLIVFFYSIDNSDKLMRIAQLRIASKGEGSAQTFRSQVEISKRYIK